MKQKCCPALSFFDYLSDLIDPRAFSSLWFWVLLLCIWMRLLTTAMGVPVDLLLRARKDPESHGGDVIDLARIYASRALELWGQGRLVQVLLGSFVLSSLLLLGVLYGMELAQATLLLLAPYAGVLALRVRTALQLESENPELERLLEILGAHLTQLRLLGWGAIFVTMLWALLSDMGRPGWF